MALTQKKRAENLAKVERVEIDGYSLISMIDLYYSELYDEAKWQFSRRMAIEVVGRTFADIYRDSVGLAPNASTCKPVPFKHINACSLIYGNFVLISDEIAKQLRAKPDIRLDLSPDKVNNYIRELVIDRVAQLIDYWDDVKLGVKKI